MREARGQQRAVFGGNLHLWFAGVVTLLVLLVLVVLRMSPRAELGHTFHTEVRTNLVDVTLHSSSQTEHQIDGTSTTVCTTQVDQHEQAPQQNASSQEKEADVGVSSHRTIQWLEIAVVPDKYKKVVPNWGEIEHHKLLEHLEEEFPKHSRCSPSGEREVPVLHVPRQDVGIVYLDCHGQWGNRLGEYVVARAVATVFDWPLRVCPVLIEELLGKGSVFPHVSTMEFDDSLLKKLDWVHYKGHDYPLDEIFQSDQPRVVHLDGYPFRNISIFNHFRKLIRTDWLHTDTECITGWHQKVPGPRDVVVHVRAYHGCGDKSYEKIYDPTHQFVDPPWEYFARILEAYRKTGGWDTLWMTCMCGMNHNMTQGLATTYGAKLAPHTEHHPDTSDWLFMKSAKRLIMSQSTYAWWAAWLGDAEEVHYPLVGDWWGRNPRHQLYPEDSKYIFHDLLHSEYFLTYKEAMSRRGRS
eukprot:m.102470 g.102470  ORF g.102470 m.102470 type:complete len:467 (+) comp13223_c2_seq2:82-1482(+)